MPPLDIDPNTDATQSGEEVEIGEEQSDVEENEDGSAFVVMDDKTTSEDLGDFFENLVGKLPIVYLSQVAGELLDLVELDQEARKDRDKKYSEALRRSGLTDELPAGADFDGASTVVHPMMLEADVDFTARICREMLPPEGPVRDKIVGKTTQAKADKAHRKVEHMNWQLTTQIREYRAEMEQGISQVMPAGVFYLKWWWDARMGRPACKAVYLDEVLLPYSASSFMSANRRTHVLLMTDQELEEAVDSGMYVEAPAMGAAGMEPERTETGKTAEKIEGKQPSGRNEDGERILYEIQVWRTVDGDKFANGRRCSYIITVDMVSRAVIGFYRNWDPEKDKREQVVEEFDCMVEYPFIRFRGAYPLSVYHLIGQLSIAATGTLRALLDSGFVNTVPTAIKLKGGLGVDGGQSQEIQPNTVNEIDGGLTTDDVRKAAMPLPFNPPSSALFQLLGFLVEAGKGVVRTTFEDLADSNANTPVGTTLARYEQGMVVFSSIFGRLHAAQEQSFAILHRLNRYYMKESVLRDDTGEVLAKRADYEGPMDVQPVSDPRIYSDTQRQMRAIMVVQRGTGNPLYDQRRLEEMFLEQNRIPDGDKLLIQIPQPRQMNAVNENFAATLGKPIAAFPEQEHLAHLQVHVDYMMSPLLGSLPIIAPVFIPSMLNHIKEHVSLWYVSLFHDMMTKMTGVEITELMDEDVDVMREFDQAIAAGSESVMSAVALQLKTLPAIVQQAMQLMQALAPQMPQDPAAQAMMAETQRKSQRDQADVQAARVKMQVDQQVTAVKVQADQQRLAAEAADKARKAQFDEQRLVAEQEEAEAMRKQDAEQALQNLADSDADRTSKETIAAEAIASKERINTQDNTVAMAIAAEEIRSGEKVAVSTGKGIGKNPQPR